MFSFILFLFAFASCPAFVEVGVVWLLGALFGAIGEEFVREAAFLLLFWLVLGMGAVGEGVAFFLFDEMGVAVDLRGVLVPGGDFRPAVALLVVLEPVGDVFPEEGGVLLVLVGVALGFSAVDTFGGVALVTDTLLGTSGGDSGGSVLGGGGGGASELGGVASLFAGVAFGSNCDLRECTFLLEKVLVATAWILWDPELAGGVAPELWAGLFCSKIEIRSLMPFLVAAALLILNC